MRDLFRIFKMSFIWHHRNPYGYCDGWNYQTCLANNNDCICVQMGIHCEHIIDKKVKNMKLEKIANYIETNTNYVVSRGSINEESITVYQGSTCVAIINAKLRVKCFDSRIQIELKDIIQKVMQ